MDAALQYGGPNTAPLQGLIKGALALGMLITGLSAVSYISHVALKLKDQPSERIHTREIKASL